jgi:hypothetical protein
MYTLNSATGRNNGNVEFSGTDTTATTFSVGNDPKTNANGGSYVAYLFAHDTAADGLIQCGSFTTDASGNASVASLGWEPQFLLVKDSLNTGDWIMLDSMRGWNLTSSDALLRANLANAETTTTDYGNPTATGFDFKGGSASATYIYVAIRRSNKPPTAGTQVFQPLAQTGTGAATTMNFGIVTDWIWSRLRAATGSVCGPLTWDRLRGPLLELNTSTTDAESSRASSVTGFDSMVGALVGTTYPNSSSTGAINYSFKRAAGFFDVVCYTGNGATNRAISHNLGAVPELVIAKTRTLNIGGFYDAWVVGAPAVSVNQTLQLAANSAISSGVASWGAHTASNFLIGTDTRANNDSGMKYVAYLFASLPGVSKIGTYTGNGSSQTVNCGFSAGARFVLIKRTDSTGNWYFWDTARGIVAGNDPWLTTNDNSIAEQTADDSVDSDSSGFVVNQNATTNINVSSATYLYLAIA